MAGSLFVDEPQTVELLRSVTRLMAWMRSVPRVTRQRLLAAMAECSDEVRDVVLRMESVVENPQATPQERQRALATIADVLLPKPDDEEEHAPSQQAAFADRLQALMTEKCVTQQELAQRIGCSQPAVSQMLKRSRRPHKKTILKLAEALSVPPHELWPDLEVADMLDAVAGFQQDDYVLTQAEAEALRDASRRNSPKIPVRSLPVRRR
ncbi:MAG: helix-turn-helix domain-containing protein [Pirellulaceae bacterium]|jgi:transcriptional regulator with XRE-family HTH domain|nr:helix-turn-helix domain-containing protein [Pirellulaceae bacterium]